MEADQGRGGGQAWAKCQAKPPRGSPQATVASGVLVKMQDLSIPGNGFPTCGSWVKDDPTLARSGEVRKFLASPNEVLVPYTKVRAQGKR